MSLKSLVLVVAVALPATSFATDGGSLAGWAQSHPAASQAFEGWLRQFPSAAHRLFVWDRHHPLRAQSFVQWCAASPGEPLESFESAHGDWPIVDAMFKPNGAALAAFVGWAETHPQAARELVEEPRGLAWVGFHLFRADWAAAEGQSPEPAPSPVDPAAPPEAK